MLCVSPAYGVGAGSNLRDSVKAEVKGDSLVDEDEAEDVASNSSSSIRFRQAVSPSSSSSLSHSQIQLQQCSRVAEARAGAEDSRW